MSYRSDGVKRWRSNTKKRIVESMGGKCMVCGYKECIGALALHHLKANTKEYTIGQSMAHPIKWTTLVLELRKCVLLCSNCHIALHSNVIKLPKKLIRFNESYAQRRSQAGPTINCPVCNKSIPAYNITCSRKCAAVHRTKAPWNTIDIKRLRNKGLSWDSIGDMLRVSGNAVKKHFLKYSQVG